MARKWCLSSSAVVRVFLITGAAQACSANSLQLQLAYRPGEYSNGVGGEFKAYNVIGVASAQKSPAVLDYGTFQTFCIEYTEEFIPDSVLYGEISKGARFGGAGGSEPDLVNGGTWDPLDSRTAYLYTLFSLGTLPNYNYGVDRSTTAGQLQKAIWFLEEEIGSLDVGDTLAKGWVDLATNAHPASIGNVRVLNLWTDPNLRDQAHRAQDQLVLLDGPAGGPPPPATPLPMVATSGTVLFGLLGVARQRRARRA